MWSSGGGCAIRRVIRQLAGGASAPIRDLCFVNDKSVRVARGDTGRDSNGAIDVDHRAAGPTDEMVVIVPHTRVVPRGRARRFDAPGEADTFQRVEDVVYSLGRNAAEFFSDGSNQRVGIRMRPMPDRR